MRNAALHDPAPPDRLLSSTTQLAGAGVVDVRFIATNVAPGEEVLLHLNTLTDNDRDDFSRWIMRADPVMGEHSITVALPADGAYSYRFVRGTPLDRSAGATRERWRQIHRTGEPDPANPERLQNPLGAQSSVWRGPAAPQAPTGTAGASWRPLSLTHADGRSRSVWRLAASAPTRAQLVLFDGNLWATDPLAHAFATRLPAVDVLAIDARSLADRAADLTSLEAAEALLRDALVHADDGIPLIVAGQSFGGLAAATLAIHRPDLVAAAIAQSGSYWHRADAAGRDVSQTGDLIDHLARTQLSSDVRLMVQVGTDEAHLRPASAKLRDVARAAGASVSYTEYRGGHDYAWWHPALFDALEQLLG